MSATLYNFQQDYTKPRKWCYVLKCNNEVAKWCACFTVKSVFQKVFYSAVQWFAQHKKRFRSSFVDISLTLLEKLYLSQRDTGDFRQSRLRETAVTAVILEPCHRESPANPSLRFVCKICNIHFVIDRIHFDNILKWDDR